MQTSPKRNVDDSANSCVAKIYIFMCEIISNISGIKPEHEQLIQWNTCIKRFWFLSVYPNDANTYIIKTKVLMQYMSYTIKIEKILFYIKMFYSIKAFTT